MSGKKHALIPCSSSWFSLPEALTGLLIPLPFLFASAAYSSCTPSNSTFPPLSAYAQLQAAVSGMQDGGKSQTLPASSLIQTCTLTSGTLLLVGILSQLQSRGRVLDRRKEYAASLQKQAGSLLTVSSLQMMGRNTLSLACPIYAALHLGGMRVGLFMLTAISSGLTCPDKTTTKLSARLASIRAIGAAFAICIIADVAGLTISAPYSSLVSGYIVLFVSILILQPPLPVTTSISNAAQRSKAGKPPLVRANSWIPTESATSPSNVSPLVVTPSHSLNTLVAGMIMAAFTFFASVIRPSALPASLLSIVCCLISIITVTGLVLVSRPAILRSSSKFGLAIGCLFTAASSFLYSPSTFPGTVVNGALSALAYIAVLYDTHASSTDTHDHHHHDAHAVHTGHSHDDHHHHTHHHHTHEPTNVSAFSKFLLARVKPGSLMHGILCEKDSRRIAYFTWCVSCTCP